MSLYYLLILQDNVIQLLFFVYIQLFQRNIIIYDRPNEYRYLILGEDKF